MDLRHMRHFVAVAEERHFGRAARRLNMAQPPLSQSIRRLEVDLGVDLFNRTKRAVELTDSGRIFLVEARRTLMQAELAKKMARRAGQGSVEVRISFIGPALYRVLPHLMVKFREEFPAIDIRLFERTSPEQINGVLAGDFDIGFVTAGTEYVEGCQTLLIESTGFLAAVPASWPVADLQEVSLKILAEQPFILPPQKLVPQGPDTLSIFKSAGMMPIVAQEATQTNTTLSLVGAGLGCSFVMATTALAHSRNVKLIPISDYQPMRRWELVLAWPFEHLTGAAAAFVEVARAELAAHPEWLDPDAAIEDL